MENATLRAVRGIASGLPVTRQQHGSARNSLDSGSKAIAGKERTPDKSVQKQEIYCGFTKRVPLLVAGLWLGLWRRSADLIRLAYFRNGHRVASLLNSASKERAGADQAMTIEMVSK
jgi:hypothetical protein